MIFAAHVTAWFFSFLGFVLATAGIFLSSGPVKIRGSYLVLLIVLFYSTVYLVGELG